MPDLDPDALLSTTRAVRKRLDLTRAVPRHLIEECLALAQQAPTGGNRQSWSFVVVTDAERRAALAEVYRRGWERYVTEGIAEPPVRPDDPGAARRQRRIASSALFLARNLQHVPVHVVPCIRPRTEGRETVVQASIFGSILPAVWSFMLAARARGLGTAWTTIHLFDERAAAEILGIPYDDVMQVALIPLAYATGAEFRPAPRAPLESFTRWEGWGDDPAG